MQAKYPVFRIAKIVRSVTVSAERPALVGEAGQQCSFQIARCHSAGHNVVVESIFSAIFSQLLFLDTKITLK